MASVLSAGMWGCSDNETNPPAPHEPDLVVVTFTPPEELPLTKPGDRVGLPAWLAENRGDVAAGAFSIGYYLSTDDQITTADALLDSLASPGLEPAHDLALADSMAIPAGTAPGTYYVGVLLDRKGDVQESNEANNTRSARVDVTPLADLALPAAPTFHPSDTYPDGRVNFDSWLIGNPGTSASPPCEYGYYLSTDAAIDTLDTYLGGGSAPAIAAHTNFTVDPTNLQIPEGMSPGNYYLGVYVDRTGVVEEYRETNNGASRPFQVKDLPDLIISSGPITATHTSITAGSSIGVMAGTIENIGEPLQLLTSFQNGFYLSTDAEITASDVFLGAALGPLIYFGPIAVHDPYRWEEATLTIPADTTPGSYYIGVLVDRMDGIYESNETNNDGSTALTVTGPP